MKGRLFLNDETDLLQRAALLVDGRLEAIEIDRRHDTGPRVGAVYRARVIERMTAMEAAFVDLGGGIRGFLADAAEARPGDEMTVQVRREPEGDKAARVSADIQIAHPLLVHTPFNAGINLSRKIADPATREALRAALDGLSGGYVIRTAARAAEPERLREIAGSLALPLKDEPGLLRDAPNALERLRLAYEDAPVETDFEIHDMNSRIEELLEPRATLAEGAWMTLEPTAALVAIDVNTGKARGGDALQRTNLAAAQEIPRQLRLRHLGGAIAIDFAGGPKGKARRRLEAAMEPALRPLGWGPAGWMELTMRKPGRSLAELLKGSR